MTQAVDLRGRTALVTGGSRGIGAAIALDLAKAGARVALLATDAAALEAQAVRINRLTGRSDPPAAEGKVADISEPAAMASVREWLAATFGHLDILVNNAGVMGPLATLADASPEAWRRAIDINIGGTMLVLNAALPLLRRAPAPRVVSLTSGAARVPMPGWSAYCVSKAGTDMLHAVLAREEPDLKVFALNPGPVDTRMQKAIRAAAINAAVLAPEDCVPAEDAARIVSWLCSGAGDDLAGQPLNERDAPLRERAGLPPRR